MIDHCVIKFISSKFLESKSIQYFVNLLQVEFYLC